MKPTVEEIIENACEWIEALAASDYEQARGRMGRDGAHCCLGVGRVLLGSRGTQNLFLDIFLDTKEMQSLGLRDKAGTAIKFHKSLTNLNDVERKTHPEIAIILISHTDKYFKDPEVVEGIREYFYKEA